MANRRMAWVMWLLTPAFLLGTSPLLGQSKLDLDLRAGFAVPAGDLDEVGEPGGGFGAGLGWRVHERLMLRLDGDVEILGTEIVGGSVHMPRTYLYHYHGGLEIDVLGSSSPWRVRLRGSGGGTTYDTEEFEEGGDDFLDTYFSAAAGVGVGRVLSSGVELGLIGQAYFVFTDEDRTQEIANQSPLLNPFSRTSSFPVQLYARWSPRW